VKKITVALLTAVYLLSAIGVSASSFYCCGLRTSTTFSLGDVSASNSQTKADNCCKTTKQSFKVKDNHFGSGSFSLLTKFFPALHQPDTFLSLNTKSFTAVHAAFNSHAPPFRQRGPIYILNCTYRI
jgi:hypothetical protein